MSTYKLFLGSSSPRRVELLTQMNIFFEQRKVEVEEMYPPTLQAAEITDFLAKLKGKAHQENLLPNQLVLTADTIVWHEKKALGKPRDTNESKQILQSLSGKTHEVISSVCLSSANTQTCINDTTLVTMRKFSNEEIMYYINTFKPFDKAGAYGIQEWIGLVGVSHIHGSYSNVVGLPTEKTYQLLKPYINCLK